MNTENLSPAMMKAIEAGGTNNAVIGGSLRKRGIMVLAEAAGREAETKYVLSAEYIETQRKETVREGIASLPTPAERREAAIREVAAETGEEPSIVAEMYDSLTSMDEEAKLVELHEGPDPDAAYEPQEYRRPLDVVELPEEIVEHETHAEPLPAPAHPRDRGGRVARPVSMNRAVIVPERNITQKPAERPTVAKPERHITKHKTPRVNAKPRRFR